MSKPSYCIKCGEAVQVDDVITSITTFQTGWTGGRIQWKRASYGVCLNDECPRYALLSTLISPNHFTPEKKKK